MTAPSCWKPRPDRSLDARATITQFSYMVVFKHNSLVDCPNIKLCTYQGLVFPALSQPRAQLTRLPSCYYPLTNSFYRPPTLSRSLLTQSSHRILGLPRLITESCWLSLTTYSRAELRWFRLRKPGVAAQRYCTPG